MRKLLSLVLALVMVCSAMSFAFAAEATVKLNVWCGDLDVDLITEMAEAFKALHPETTFEITVGIQSESKTKDVVLTDIEAAADVFAFADDQINQLVAAGALQPVVLNTDAIIEANGGADSAAVQAATVDGTLYAYPMTADNGYFMFYDKSVFTEEDVQTLDKMMEVAAAADSKITMTLDSGWYLYSFFKGAGLDLELDGVNNVCNWDATDTEITGEQVTDALLAITSNPGFISLTDAEFQTGIKGGNIVAGVNGIWNATVAQEAWGDNYAAIKLPTYTVAGQQKQMSSFAGFKLIGVNGLSKEAGWAMQFADFITNEENQILRFEKRNQGPSNVVAAASEAVQTDPAIAALAAQAAYATIQRVGDNYWAPTETFGAIMKTGNPDKISSADLVKNLVIGITALIQ